MGFIGKSETKGKTRGRKMIIKIAIGVVLGGIFGFFFYRFIGCKSGACVITGNPYISTIYWALLGGLVANIL
jgi:hypothetical protein